MANLKNYIKSLFLGYPEIDKDLQKILRKALNDKYSFQGEIKNIRFAETASHVMFFNSNKMNSLSNAPLNAKIFSHINDSNISLSFSTSKIKLNNPSSPLYLDFFGSLIRVFPNEGYKNSFVYCLGKLTPSQIKSYKKSMELAYKQYIVKNIKSLEGSEFFKNKGSMDDPNFLNKCIYKNQEESLLIEKEIKFKRNIYEGMIDDMMSSYHNNNHKTLADQVNYVQSNLINKVFSSKSKHYYLPLEEVGSKLFLEKLNDEDSFINKMFHEGALRPKIWEFLNEPLFLKKDGLSLNLIDNKNIFCLTDVKNLISQIERGETILNTKFSLFIISFYGLQIFGGRFQKSYMPDFIRDFQKLLKEIFSKKRGIIKSINERIEQIKFFDIASIIIAKKKDKSFCDYDALLLGKYNLDENFSALCSQDIDVILKNTEEYLKTKK